MISYDTMDKSYNIDISIRSLEGTRRIARFDLGNDTESAYSLFSKLKGSPEINQKHMLYLEFLETKKGLPQNLDIISCDLQELGANTMLITQEIFRKNNLDER